MLVTKLKITRQDTYSTLYAGKEKIYSFTAVRYTSAEQIKSEIVATRGRNCYIRQKQLHAEVEAKILVYKEKHSGIKKLSNC